MELPLGMIPRKGKAALAVDLGGTKTAGALIDDSGSILFSHQERTVQSGPEEGIVQIIELLEEIIQQSRISRDEIAGIGIGIPAVLESETDLVLWAPNLNGWRNVPLRSKLEQHFNLPTRIEYDGHTAVLGEWWQGNGRGYRSLMNIIIGTGVGGGLILNERLIRGSSRLAGAIGWFVIRNTKTSQQEFEQALGRWEAWVAGPALARQAQALLAKKQSSTSSLQAFGHEVTAKEIFDAASKGDTLARHILSDWSELVGIGIANVVSLVNPDVVILGGGVGCNAAEWIPRIQATVQKYAQPFSAQQVRILVSSLGNRAGLLGAAYALFYRLEQEKTLN